MHKPVRCNPLNRLTIRGCGLTLALRAFPVCVSLQVVPRPTTIRRRTPMHEFIAKHQDKIAGTPSGFDRLVFRGHLRSIGNPQGMISYLSTNQVFLKNFGDHVEKVTERVKEASLAAAKANSSQLNKETIARNIL